MRLGEQIKQARNAKSLTILQLWAASGVQPATISRIETGTTPNPSFATIAKLFRALDLPLATIDDSGPTAAQS